MNAIQLGQASVNPPDWGPAKLKFPPSPTSSKSLGGSRWPDMLDVFLIEIFSISNKM